MNQIIKTAWILAVSTMAASGWAATYYVVPPGTIGVSPADPYTNWATAGTNLIEVVATAETNTAPRVVIVTNGVYYPTNRIVFLTTGVMLRSLNGYEHTIINGSNCHGISACVTMNSSVDTLSAGMDGFTVTNYNWERAIVSGYNYTVLNCLFVGNTVTGTAGGQGRGIVSLSWGGVVSNTIFRGNRAQVEGAALLCSGNDTYPRTLLVNRCHFESNSVYQYYSGGAIYLTGLGGAKEISDCFFNGNTAVRNGGAVYDHGTGSGAIEIRNSLFINNTAQQTNGGAIYLNNGLVESCTIVSNNAGTAGGGLYIYGTARGTNNIVYYNWTDGAPETHNFVNTAGDTGLDYSCVTPAVTGTDNITADPDLSADFQPRIGSPCINAGLNLPWMLEADAVDLDGRRRVDAIHRRVDMGCHEFSFYGTMIKVR